ncbi:Fic family protein [Pseudogracilibacillus sp. SO30301A]|uniref:Fic family protein n=1 Tax=Pseudogracilibacillus sp. SO30301A TaxID=3098291 RepID=UPI00300DE965
MKIKSNYLLVLDKERKEKIKNGLYEYTLINMSYNTNRMEGSTLSLSDTKDLFERNTLYTGGHNVDDIIEGKNHFDLFNFMLDTIKEPLTERLIREYHQLLKRNTLDVANYGVEKYKGIPNIVGDQPTAEPHEVEDLMYRLVNEHPINDLMDILSFHHQFELIHPFQDGNGRVGRIIMFRQCLERDVTPFIIPSDKREEYINGLKLFNEDPIVLKNEIENFQENYKKIAKPFLKVNSRNRRNENESELID